MSNSHNSDLIIRAQGKYLFSVLHLNSNYYIKSSWNLLSQTMDMLAQRVKMFKILMIMYKSTWVRLMFQLIHHHATSIKMTSLLEPWKLCWLSSSGRNEWIKNSLRCYSWKIQHNWKPTSTIHSRRNAYHLVRKHLLYWPRLRYETNWPDSVRFWI